MAFVKFHKFQVGDTVVTNNIVRNLHGWFEIGTIMTIINVHSNCTFDLVDDEGNKVENARWNDIRLLENKITRYRDKISHLKRNVYDIQKHGKNIEITQDILDSLYQAQKHLEKAEKEINAFIKHGNK